MSMTRITYENISKKNAEGRNTTVKVAQIPVRIHIYLRYYHSFQRYYCLQRIYSFNVLDLSAFFSPN